jgi:hypothetical protein
VVQVAIYVHSELQILSASTRYCTTPSVATGQLFELQSMYTLSWKYWVLPPDIVLPLSLQPDVGEFRKTRHPRNVEFNQILKMCFSGAKHSRFLGILDLQSLGVANMRESWTGEASGSRTCDFRESWICEASESLWRPRFLITVINANDQISRSNGQPGPSPMKTP